MSILIKGMEMPEDGGLLCIKIYPNGKVAFDMDLKSRQIAEAFELPSHGDLIDVDEQIRLMRARDYDTYDDYVRALDMLDKAPTIIPAERKLKPCPFCGGAKIDIRTDDDGVSWYTFCNDCGVMCGYSMTKDDAINAWNERADAPANDTMKHGKWKPYYEVLEETPDYSVSASGYECSECGTIFHNQWDFCGNCGAVMEKIDEN